jgi:hypothetical protein
MIITVALFAGALIAIIAVLVYALLQQADIIQQLGEIQREVAYIGRVVSAYDKREAKQHVKLPPVEVKKPRSVPAPDLTLWGGGSI